MNPTDPTTQPNHRNLAARTSQDAKCCLNCGAPLDRKEIKKGEPPRLYCEACGFTLYEDPKVATGVIVQAGENGVVLLKRGISPGKGKWVFPGGFVDRGEILEEAAARETLEESGLIVKIERLLKAYSYHNQPVIILVYIGRATGGSLAPLDETLDAAVFEPEEIPWRQLAFPSTQDALRDYFREAGMGGRIPAEPVALDCDF